MSLSTAFRAASPLIFAGSSTPRSSRCEAADRMTSCVSVSLTSGSSVGLRRRRCRHHHSPALAMQPAGQDPEARLVPGTVTLPLRSRTNASPFWIMLLRVSGRRDHGMIRIRREFTPSAGDTPRAIGCSQTKPIETKSRQRHETGFATAISVRDRCRMWVNLGPLAISASATSASRSPTMPENSLALFQATVRSITMRSPACASDAI